MTDAALAERFYDDWLLAEGEDRPPENPTLIPTTKTIQQAISDGGPGDYWLNDGTHMIDRTVDVPDGTRIFGTTDAVVMNTSTFWPMFAIGGAYFKETGLRAEGDWNSQYAFLGVETIPVGTLVKIGNNDSHGDGGFVGRIVDYHQGLAIFEAKLPVDLDGHPVLQCAAPAVDAALYGFTLKPIAYEPTYHLSSTVREAVLLRAAERCRVGLNVDGDVGLGRSAVYLRESYRCQIDEMNIDDALIHGDEGQAYGVNVGSNSTLIHVRRNLIRRMRHSIIVHGGASAVLIEENMTSDPKHPNPPNGGATEMSFHGRTDSCLVQNNTFGRLMLVDAGSPGRHNVIGDNTYTTGPLTLDGSRRRPLEQITVLGGTSLGSVENLRERITPSLSCFSSRGIENACKPGAPSAPLVWWATDCGTKPKTSGPDPFDEHVYIPNPDRVGGDVVIRPDLRLPGFDPARPQTPPETTEPPDGLSPIEVFAGLVRDLLELSARETALAGELAALSERFRAAFPVP